MRLLSLNCQKGYNPNFPKFFKRIFGSGEHEFILLQEATEEVFAHIPEVSGGYKLLLARHPETGGQSHLCVAYRPEFRLEDADMIPLATNQPRFAGHPSFGLLLGIFSRNGQKMRIGSMHLQSSIQGNPRLSALTRFKQSLISKGSSLPTIVGGDCNFGPTDLRRATLRMAPEFICATKELGPTLNSRYSESNQNIANKAAVLMAKLGLGVSLRADHFFVDKNTLDVAETRCRILPDRISDHSPIEMRIR